LTLPPDEPLEQRLETITRLLQKLEIERNLPAPAEEPARSARGRQEVSVKTPDALSLISQRLAESSPFEALQWLEVRREISKQDQNAEDRQHLRRMEKWGIGGKLALSGLAIISGVGLAFGGFGYPAFICMGAGLYNLAPEFISGITRRFRRGDKE
jgi:hypothetical protein